MDKKYLAWIAVGLLAILLFVGGLFLSSYVVSQVIVPAFAERSVPQATPTLSRQTSVFTAMPIITPTPTPTATPTPYPAGSVWSVVSIDPGAYRQNGYVYDIGTFKNIITGEVLKAHCAAPTWASPPIGAEYAMNIAGVLIPVREKPNHYQRFIVLDN